MIRERANRGEPSNLIPRWLDPFVVAIVAVMALATLRPARGEAAALFEVLAAAGIALLFFLHGARLSRQTIATALAHWRLHLLVVATTFVAFPVLGLAAAGALAGHLPAPLTTGIVFLACAPSTVQSSIAFTAIARGNVAAAVGAAAISNLLGVVLTPALVALLIGSSAAAGAGADADGGAGSAVRGVALQLLLPFVAGQIARRWLAGWVSKRRRLLGWVDRASILLVVYSAFSTAVVGGLWQAVSASELLVLLAVSAALLLAVIGLTQLGARALGLARDDRVAVVFCGSKKSLATGVPLAGLLFPEALAGKVLLPLMVFHQLQLVVMAVIAGRWGRDTFVEKTDVD